MNKFASAVILAVVLAPWAPLGAAPKKPKAISTDKERAEAIRHAQVWRQTDVASMDIKAGPDGKGSFPPDATVTCTYSPKKMSGNTPKFACIIPPKDELKVKYGRKNGEVFAEVAASRLLWALGFYAERMYPVRVQCQGCPPKIVGTDMASVQRKLPGHDIATKKIVGWAWPELETVDSAAGGAPRAQRDALKLLAVFIVHSDSKPEQQRLICADDECATSIMMIHDLGLTFGKATKLNGDMDGSVNLEGWTNSHIWKDQKRCVADLPESQTGTLSNPLISEGGRKFLAGLLAQLTDQQIYDLFAVARFNRRSTTSDRDPDTTSIDQWVTVFKQKRDQINSATCPG